MMLKIMPSVHMVTLMLMMIANDSGDLVLDDDDDKYDGDDD